jgi:hypothetical protein
MFFKGSRYAKVADDSITDAQGREIRFKKVRFINTPSTLVTRTLAPGQRLDHLANQMYKNPELFWRICDANTVMRPDELETTPGTPIGIPASED